MLTPEEIRADINSYRRRLENPEGLSDAQIAIYRQAIIEAETMLAQAIAAQQGPQNPIPAAPAPTPIKHTTPPPPTTTYNIPSSPTMEESADRALDYAATWTQEHTNAWQAPNKPTPPKTATIPTTEIFAGNQTKVPATGLPPIIHVPKDTDPYNPRITITWPDNYTVTIDETEARGRFATALRDTANLRLAQEGRYTLIWRWSSPWRALGYYRALTTFRGAPPSLRDLGITRQGEITLAIFDQIKNKQ